MRFLSFYFIAFASGFTYSQSAISADLTYESEFKANEIEFYVGDTIVFAQNCTDKVPNDLVNHSIQFNNYYIKNIHYRFVLFFEDTVVRKTVYHYEGKQIDSALANFNLSLSQFQLYDKKLKFYSKQQGNRLTTCWIDDNRIYFCEELLKKY